MKNVNTYVGRIVSLDRMASSETGGNPRYMVEFELEEDNSSIYFCTTPDSSMAYEIPNYEGKYIRLEVKVGIHYGKQSLDSLIKL